MTSVSKMERFGAERCDWEDANELTEVFYTKSPIFVNNLIIFEVVLNPFVNNEQASTPIKLTMILHGYNKFQNRRTIFPSKIANVNLVTNNTNRIKFKFCFETTFIITRVFLSFEFSNSKILRCSFKNSLGRFLINNNQAYFTSDIFISKKMNREKGISYWINY